MYLYGFVCCISSINFKGLLSKIYLFFLFFSHPDIVSYEEKYLKKIFFQGQEPVAHACIPSHSGGRDQRDHG
jgi:hypothetical protein